MAATEVVEAVLGRFRGCMVGSLLGDCLGAPFEGDKRVLRAVLNSYFHRLGDRALKVPYKPYTDDTAMTRCVADSLIENKGYDATDMAKRLVKEYYSDPRRGYGMNVIDVFAALRASKFKDIYVPAGLQFGGTGSYGNGAAMRVAPIALFCYSDSLDQLISYAKDSALLTHANRLGYNGAILQCLAVHSALKTAFGSLDTVKFVEDLIKIMKGIETPKDNEILRDGEDPFVYVKQLGKVLELMEQGSAVTPDTVEMELGVYISAHFSVPTAIYVFLRSIESIDGIEADNPFQRTVQYAIGLGGDTDTIASMAGSIAGAYYGVAAIPDCLIKHCEASDYAMKQANSLHKIVQKKLQTKT